MRSFLPPFVVGLIGLAVVTGSFPDAQAQIVPPVRTPTAPAEPIIPRTTPGITDPVRDPTLDPRAEPIPPRVPGNPVPGDTPGDLAPGPMIPQDRSAPASTSIPDQIAAGAQFKILAGLLKKSGLDRTLAGEGPYTLIAPYDKAFSDLPAETLESLEQPENVDKLIAILKLHVLPGRMLARTLAPLDRVETAGGRTITVARDGDTLRLGDAKVLEANVPATNGVIHVVDKVIVP